MEIGDLRKPRKNHNSLMLAWSLGSGNKLDILPLGKMLVGVVLSSRRRPSTSQAGGSRSECEPKTCAKSEVGRSKKSKSRGPKELIFQLPCFLRKKDDLGYELSSEAENLSNFIGASRGIRLRPRSRPKTVWLSFCCKSLRASPFRPLGVHNIYIYIHNNNYYY